MRMPDEKWSLQIRFSYRKAAVFLLSISHKVFQREKKQAGILAATVLSLF